MLRNTRKTTGFFLFLLLLGSFAACSNAKETTPKTSTNLIKLDLLLGKWQSTSNSKTRIELTKERMYSYHGDLRLADEVLTIYHNCVSRCVPTGVEPMPCLVTDGKMAENCFEVLELTKTTLAYKLINGDGKILKFTKM